jgi:urease accessory protein
LRNSCKRFMPLPQAVAALLVFLFSSPAYAHPDGGASSGLVHGLIHPFSGLDHVCAMVAVGLWAAQVGGCAVWRLPLTFVSVMALGGLLGMANIPVSFVEAGVVASLLVLGMMVATAARFPLQVCAAIIAVFAFFHGYVHGTESPLNHPGVAYVAGFVLSTSMLHITGLGMAWIIREIGRPAWIRLAGAAIMLCGGAIWAVG